MLSSQINSTAILKKSLMLTAFAASVFAAPAMADDRLYNVGAALERELLAKWGKPLLDFAPELS